MKLIDPNREHIDLIAFDGTLNIQKARQLLTKHFLRCQVIQGLEHTVSLIFGNYADLRPINEMCVLAKKVCFCCNCHIYLLFTNLLFLTQFGRPEMYLVHSIMHHTPCLQGSQRHTMVVGC